MAVKTVHYASHTFKISYEIVNPDARYDIVFLHGWGSNKELMKQAFGTHLDMFRHIYVDMPGFGGSTCDMPLETEDYAAILESFFAQINAQREIVVGHSFGGKVATLVNPELLVLIASSGVLLPKPLGVRLKIMLFKALKSVGLSALRSTFVAEDAKALSAPMYETFKRVVNEDFLPKFRLFNKRALLCWGREDTATPLHTAYTTAEAIGTARVVEFDGDHYFFLNSAAEVAAQIAECYLDRMER